MRFLVLSTLAMFAATMINYRVLARWSYAALGLAIVLLAAVYFFPPVNGAQRWIRLGPLNLQPSEFAKLAFVLGLARYLMYRDSHRQLRGLLIPLAMVLAPALLVLREPDLGTALVFFPVLFVMLVAAGARREHLILALAAGCAMTPLLWSQMSREQRSRITALTEQSGPGEKPTDDGYHLHQAKQMLALGGIWGSLLAGEVADDPTVYSVPEPHTDSIMTVIMERTGLCGLTLMLSMFLLLVWRVLAVAEATREPYGRLVAVGAAALLGVQALINTGMMVGLLPITGLALPLVSYGGSSLLANCITIGLVLNITLRPGYEVTREPFRYAAD